MRRSFSFLTVLALCLALMYACAGPDPQDVSSVAPSAVVSGEPSETPSEAPIQEPSEEPSEVPPESPSPQPSTPPSQNLPSPPSSRPSPPSSEAPSAPQPGMALDRTEIVFTAPEHTFQLTVSFTGMEDIPGVVWTSSDEGVADVDGSGLVTAMAPGTATITAKSDNGLAASCIVRCRWEETSDRPIDVDLSAFANVVLSQYAFGSPSLAGDDSIAQHFSGLTSISAQQRLVYLCQEPKNDAELVLMEVTNAGDVDAVKAILQARINTMISGGAWFPESTQIWADRSRIVSNGSYIMMVVHSQCDAIVSAFHALF